MVPPVRLDPIARAELLAAFDYLESQRTGLAKRFSRSLAAAMDEIRSHPHRFPVFAGAFRRYRVDPFQYAIVYRPGEGGEIFVASVFHLVRDQRLLRGRLKP